MSTCNNQLTFQMIIKKGATEKRAKGRDFCPSHDRIKNLAIAFLCTYRCAVVKRALTSEHYFDSSTEYSSKRRRNK